MRRRELRKRSESPIFISLDVCVPPIGCRESKMPLAVHVPKTPAQLDQVRALMRSFIAWHKERHGEDIDLINAYFDNAAFDDELSSLPGKYGSPRGQLLLATLDEAPVGCVALREIDSGTCEMKRMFVYPQHHGKGVGRALAEAIIQEARGLGYRAMRLDTSVRQAEANALYQRLGFQTIKPYYELPEDVRSWLVFMELKL
jgi:putative acetyltransferase